MIHNINYVQHMDWSSSVSDRDAASPPPTTVCLSEVVHPELEAFEQLPNMRDIQLIAGGVVAYLSQKGIQARLGGSLVARMYGAQRNPQDIDLELHDASDLNKAYDKLSTANANIIMKGSGRQAQMTGAAHHLTDGLGGMVNMTFTSPDNRTCTVRVDLTNENNPVFNRYLNSPASRGIMPVKPTIVSGEEIFINYLDRFCFKRDTAELKNDLQQMASMLRANNFDCTKVQDHLVLEAIITTFAKPELKHFYMQAITSIIHLMKTGDL
jgi:hypothetical protein